jgi:hypothetical protein
MTVLFHLTPSSNVAGILRDGLVPRIGPRATKLGERRPVVYMFSNMDDLGCALDNWLGEELEDVAKIALIRADIPPEIRRRRVAFEIQVFDTIPPDCLTIVSRDYGR